MFRSKKWQLSKRPVYISFVLLFFLLAKLSSNSVDDQINLEIMHETGDDVPQNYDKPKETIAKTERSELTKWQQPWDLLKVDEKKVDLLALRLKRLREKEREEAENKHLP